MLRVQSDYKQFASVGSVFRTLTFILVIIAIVQTLRTGEIKNITNIRNYRRSVYLVASSIICGCIGTVFFMLRVQLDLDYTLFVDMVSVFAQLIFILGIIVIAQTFKTGEITNIVHIQNYLKPIYLVAASIICGCVGTVFFLLRVQSDYKQFSNVTSVFRILTFILVIIAIVQVFRIREIKRFSVIVAFLVLVSVGLDMEYFKASFQTSYRYINSRSRAAFFGMTIIGDAINEYVETHSHMPNTNSWSSSLIEANDNISAQNFGVLAIPWINCNFAFNKNLSNLPANKLEGSVVLLFEADGELDLSGGPELINEERGKDKYYLSKKHIFIFIRFVDGTIAKYRLRDGAVALYKPSDDKSTFEEIEYDKAAHTDWFKKGQTPYSPLRWK